MCEYCEIIQKQKNTLLYEDDILVVFLVPRPVTAGHLIVLPKKHTPIFEEVDDSIAGHVFGIANKMAIAVFEAIGATGTNIIVQNGVSAGQSAAHFCINVIPRREKDGLSYDWQTQQMPEEQLKAIAQMIKNQLGTGPQEQTVASTPVQNITPLSDTKSEESEENKDNYLIKQLKRMP